MKKLSLLFVVVRVFFCLFVEVSIFTSQTFPLLYHFFQSDHFSLQEFADIFESLCKGYDYYFLY